MVTFYAQGGLGNQLFQYATARQLAFARRAALTVDLSWYRDPPSGVTPRVFDLFDIFPDLIETSERDRLYLRFLRGRMGRLLAPFSKHETIREAGFAYSPQLERASGEAYLVGYWQSERYFLDIAEDLRRELISKAPDFCPTELLSQLSTEATVSLHVRRGDYVTNTSAAIHHGTCGPEYYAKAIRHISQRISSPRFVVFSDEIAWARENIQLPSNAIFVDSDTETPAIRDILLMASCRHNIIANSSFSWWGAWLGNQDRIVLAPSTWFSSGKPTPDLLPLRWETIG